MQNTHSKIFFSVGTLHIFTSVPFILFIKVLICYRLHLIRLYRNIRSTANHVIQYNPVISDSDPLNYSTM